MKPILLTSAVAVIFSIAFIFSEITGSQQVLLFILVGAFFAVLVKGLIDGAPAQERRPH